MASSSIDVQKITSQLTAKELELDQIFMEVFSLRSDLSEKMNAPFTETMNARIEELIRRQDIYSVYHGAGIFIEPLCKTARPSLVFSIATVLRHIVPSYIARRNTEFGKIPYDLWLKKMACAADEKTCVELASMWLKITGDIPILFIEGDCRKKVRVGGSIELPSFKVVYGLMLMFKSTSITIYTAGFSDDHSAKLTAKYFPERIIKCTA